MIRRLLIAFFIGLSTVLNVKAQYVYGTTGLLHMPTADMQRDKTFLFGGSYLDIAATPEHWSYHTFNYYINITFFPWFEVGYTCTLHKALLGSNYYPSFVWGKYSNQDRQFSGRLRLWKEGWWKTWTPQIVIGANDPGTHESYGGGEIVSTNGNGNGHLQRYYIAATKHIDFEHIGNLGIHAAYVYNKRTEYHLNGLALGVNFQLHLSEDKTWKKMLNGLNLMGEYDSRTVNIGASYAIWKDYINVIAEMTECKYFSGGIFFKVHLK